MAGPVSSEEEDRQEVEITPAMLEAGFRAYRQFNRSGPQELITAVFEEMRLAQVREKPEQLCC